MIDSNLPSSFSSSCTSLTAETRTRYCLRYYCSASRLVPPSPLPQGLERKRSFCPAQPTNIILAFDPFLLDKDLDYEDTRIAPHNLRIGSSSLSPTSALSATHSTSRDQAHDHLIHDFLAHITFTAPG